MEDLLESLQPVETLQWENILTMRIAQKKEAVIQLTQKAFDFMADASANGSAKVSKDGNLNMLTQEVQYTDLQIEIDRTKQKLETCTYKDMQRLQAQLGDLKGKSCDTLCASNTLDPLTQKLEDKNVSLESQVLNYAKENACLKSTYKNLFDSIKVTQA
ncbi:hypothetical protein Tco_1487614 [Tanacetum coccineum]